MTMDTTPSPSTFTMKNRLPEFGVWSFVLFNDAWSQTGQQRYDEEQAKLVEKKARETQSCWRNGVWSFVLFNDAWSQKGHSASNTTVILA